MIEINNLLQEGDYEYFDIRCLHCNDNHLLLDVIHMKGDSNSVNRIIANFKCNICGKYSNYKVNLDIVDKVITKKILQITKNTDED